MSYDSGKASSVLSNFTTCADRAPVGLISTNASSMNSPTSQQ